MKFVNAVVDELKLGILNAYWKNLLNESVNDFKAFTGTDGEVRNKAIKL